MNPGYLSEYFEGVAAKKLSAVEADETRSNQHEYHATKNVRYSLAVLKRRREYPPVSSISPTTIPTPSWKMRF